jgi:DNA-binding transcriptional MerR regulator
VVETGAHSTPERGQVSGGEQGELFPDSSLPDELVGYRGTAACQIAGITYRQLDYWARTKLVAPSIRMAHGSGSQRLYSFKDILVLKVVKRLLDTGVSLQNIRVAVDHLRMRGVRDLARVTLFSDGTTVYECTSPEEIVDLLQGGQGVFGIAVSGAMQEISGTIHEFPAERADGGTVETVVADELSRRRNTRRTG